MAWLQCHRAGTICGLTVRLLVCHMPGFMNLPTKLVSVLTIVAAYWGQLEYRTLQLMPWIVMKRGPAGPKDSIILNYTSPNTISSLVKSAKAGHTPVTLTILGSLLLRGLSSRRQVYSACNLKRWMIKQDCTPSINLHSTRTTPRPSTTRILTILFGPSRAITLLIPLGRVRNMLYSNSPVRNLVRHNLSM